MTTAQSRSTPLVAASSASGPAPAPGVAEGGAAPFARVAVLVPCYNEEITVGQVVDDFRKALPGATIYVFDNNSKDRTSEIAREHGAEVVPSRRQGKGYVVRHMFDMVEADCYLMTDGDSTYPADAAHELIKMVRESGVDMAVGVRMQSYHGAKPRPFHTLGNHLVSTLVSKLFNVTITDALSGYRAFSRDFVKAVPLTSGGFEVETELTLQAASKGFLIRETPISYGARPEGSFSKLNTFRDGTLILRAIFTIFKHYKPLVFFTGIAGLLALASLAAGTPPIIEFIRLRHIYHVPLAILATGLGILSTICFAIGVILDTIIKLHNEQFELWRRQLKK